MSSTKNSIEPGTKVSFEDLVGEVIGKCDVVKDNVLVSVPGVAYPFSINPNDLEIVLYDYTVFFGGKAKHASWGLARTVKASSHHDAVCKAASYSQYSSGSRYLAIGPDTDRKIDPDRESVVKCFMITDVHEDHGGYLDNQEWYRMGVWPPKYDFRADTQTWMGFYNVTQIAF